jgi:stringent starvation protein B
MRAELEEALKQGRTQVLVEAGADGVSLPDHVRAMGPRVVLNLSWMYHNQMEIDDVGVRCYLSFGGRDHYCVLPWHAIVAVRSYPEQKLEHQAVKKGSHLRLVN